MTFSSVPRSSPIIHLFQELEATKYLQGGVGSTVACESALRSAGILLSRVRAPPSAPRPDEGPKSLRSPWRGLAIYKNPNPQNIYKQYDHFMFLMSMHDYVRQPPTENPSRQKYKSHIRTQISSTSKPLAALAKESPNKARLKHRRMRNYSSRKNRQHGAWNTLLHIT
ncbi:hypothetical protein PoB_001606700 [Plakobranchus ocellatus]|uniref:Uncharacterized protein n=1 Tax=Plakobranchus ocellatus TaxID=259542 RepID=A0AAV3Z4S3_9GAST|nr:hypothetical protein PoB_001606700 [Plakobranchus ocellatus]